jgi:putative transposase
MSASARGTRACPGKRVRQKAGRTLVQVGRFYPSSKTCSGCGHRLEELPLAVRHWRCPACGAEHDRDENAARNIEREGLRLLEHP